MKSEYVRPNKKVYLNFSNIIVDIYDLGLDYMESYPTDYGTIIVEWSVKEGSVFSLEIGDSSIGYFSEVAGESITTVDKLDLIKNYKESILKLKQDIKLFLNKLK